MYDLIPPLPLSASEAFQYFHYLTSTLRLFFFATGKIIPGNGRNHVGKGMHKIALKSEVKGNTQGGKCMKKHALACLTGDIFNYLFK